MNMPGQALGTDALQQSTLLSVRKGDLLCDSDGVYHLVTMKKGEDLVILQRFGAQPEPPSEVDPSDLVSYFRDDITTREFRIVSHTKLNRPDWMVLSIGNSNFIAVEEVKRMARPSKNALTPPRITKEQWRKRDHTRITLTRPEFEQIARLVTAGRSLLRGEPSISPQFKAGMSRLGIDTKGL